MYQLTILPPVERVLGKIRDRKVRSELMQAIDELAETPRPHGHTKLVGYENLYRVRVGEWRISYAIEDGELIVLVIEVAKRKDAYKNF